MALLKKLPSDFKKEMGSYTLRVRKTLYFEISITYIDNEEHLSLFCGHLVYVIPFKNHEKYLEKFFSNNYIFIKD